MTETATPTAAADSAATPGPIVATAGRYYRNARYVMTVGLIAMGAYFAYDGYKGWPDRNRQIDAVQEELDRTPKDSARWVELDTAQRKLGARKTDTDIALQKVLGYALPAVAIAYLVYFLRKSRGEIRLENDVLTVPGHPPVPLSAITSVDDSLWKKKGIAKVSYNVNGQKGVLTLDDFVYQQTPVDAIYDRVLMVRNPLS